MLLFFVNISLDIWNFWHWYTAGQEQISLKSSKFSWLPWPRRCTLASAKFVPWHQRRQQESFKNIILTWSSKSQCCTVHVVSKWHSLPTDLVNALSVNAFKSRLDRHWLYKGFCYNYNTKFEQVTQLRQRPCDACFASFSTVVKLYSQNGTIAFFSHPLWDFRVMYWRFI